jgi:hypothetical protein
MTEEMASLDYEERIKRLEIHGMLLDKQMTIG